MDADLIRLILLILGIALVAGIWLWDHWQRGRGKAPMAQRKAEPAPGPESEQTPQWDEPDEAVEVSPSASRAEEDHPDTDEPSLYLTPETGEAEEPVPQVQHRPAWVQPIEPVIPAFLMAAESEPLPDEPDQQTPEQQHVAAVPPVLTETEATAPEDAADSEPLLYEAAAQEPSVTEPLLVVDDAAEPEVPVLELQAEPIHAAAKPARSKPRETAPKTEAEPVNVRLEEDQFDLDLGFSAMDEQDLQEVAADLPQLILQINIVARSGPFTGDQILAAMDQVEMQAGEHNIFHRRDNRVRGGKPRVLFSLASMVEPGSFPLKKMKDFTTPGLTLFTQLPGPRDGLLVYSDMLYVAERLARLLDARLKDEQRSTLTKQTIEHTRERIAEHKRQITLKLRQADDKHRGRR